MTFVVQCRRCKRAQLKNAVKSSTMCVGCEKDIPWAHWRKLSEDLDPVTARALLQHYLAEGVPEAEEPLRVQKHMPPPPPPPRRPNKKARVIMLVQRLRQAPIPYDDLVKEFELRDAADVLPILVQRGLVWVGTRGLEKGVAFASADAVEMLQEEEARA